MLGYAAETKLSVFQGLDEILNNSLFLIHATDETKLTRGFCFSWPQAPPDHCNKRRRTLEIMPWFSKLLPGRHTHTHTHTHTHITATTSDFYSYLIGQNQSHAHNKPIRGQGIIILSFA